MSTASSIVISGLYTTSYNIAACYTDLHVHTKVILGVLPIHAIISYAALKRFTRPYLPAYNIPYSGIPWWTTIFIFGTACQIYCYGRYCVRRSVSPQVPENPSGPLVDNFIVLPCVAFGVACVKLLPGVNRWNSLDDPRVIGPCHCEVWGWPRH